MKPGPSFLHLSPIAPALSGNGLAMRSSMFSEALARLGMVDVAVIGGPARNSRDLPAVTLHHIETQGRPDTRLSLISRIPDPMARAAALRAGGRPLAARAMSAPVLADAARIFGDGAWSGLVLSRAYLLPLLDALPPGRLQGPVVVDLDDDDATFCRQWASLARDSGDAGQAELMEAEADSFDTMISAYADRVSAFTCASEDASKAIASRLGLATLRTVPNGIDLSRMATSTASPKALIFVGNLSYGPNVDGLLWFIANVFPLIRTKEPEARLIVAGSLPGPGVRQACTADGISLHADPEDLVPLYREAGAAVVPLRLGSGTRIKILEAAVHGLPVVSTRKGAEGLGAEMSAAIFLTDEEPDACAQACLDCLGRKPGVAERAAMLQRLVREHHDRALVIAGIARLFEDLL